jgi:hypothetical protein
VARHGADAESDAPLLPCADADGAPVVESTLLGDGD